MPHRTKAARLIGSEGPRNAGDLCLLQRELFDAARIEQMTGHSPKPFEWPEWSGELVSASTALGWATAERIIYLEPTLLRDSDAFSMAHSIELRVPFVDRPFRESALAIAGETGAKRGKRNFTDLIDDERLSTVAHRPKTGFSIPMATLMTDGALRHVVEEAREASSPVWSHLDRSICLPLLDDNRIRSRWSEGWAIAALNGWLTSLRPRSKVNA
jgi:asparagine synthase (glutamine-hydrolysing)